MKVLLQILGLFAGGGVVFALAFYITFPSDTVAERIAWEAQERLELAVDVEKPKPKGIGGVRFKSLQVGKLPKGDEPVRPFLSLGKTWVKVGLIKALRGEVDARFDGVLFDGKAKGDVQYSETAIAADVTLDDLQVSAFPLQGETWSIDGAGSLDGKVDLSIDQEDVTQSQGQVSFDFDGLTFLEGSQIYGLDFETVFTEAGGRITVENGRATIDKAKFKGDKLEGEATGYVSLKKDLVKSRMALKVKFKLLDESLDGLLAIKMGKNPSHKDDKGFYHYLISGPIDRPRPREDRAAARRSNRNKGKAATDTGEEADDEDQGSSKRRTGSRAKRLDEMTDEEKAEWERERDERREALRKKREERRREVEGGSAERGESREREVHRKDEDFGDDIRVGGTRGREELTLDGPEDVEEYDEDEEGGGDTDDEPEGEFEGGEEY